MSDLDNKIPFAIRQVDGKIVGIDDVQSGLGCECVCPACNAVLVAKKCQTKADHFAHHRKSSEVCEYAAETSIRLMLLEALQHENLPHPQSITLPKLHVHVDVCDEHYGLVESADYSTDRTCPPVHISALVGHPQVLLAFVSPDDNPIPAVGIGLYLPPAHQLVTDDDVRTPNWIGQCVMTWPQRGLLVVNYRALLGALWQRPEGVTITDHLIKTLFEGQSCLSWLYHPSESAIRVKLTEFATNKLALRVHQRQEDELRRQEHDARLRQAVEEANRRRAANVQGENARINQDRYEDRRYRHQPTTSMPGWKEAPRCAVCNAALSDPSTGKVCGRPSCIEEYSPSPNQRHPSMSPEDIKSLILSSGSHPDSVPLIQPLLEYRMAAGWLVLTDEHIWYIAEASAGGWKSCNVRYAAGMRDGHCLPKTAKMESGLRFAFNTR